MAEVFLAVEQNNNGKDSRLGYLAHSIRALDKRLYLTDAVRADGLTENAEERQFPSTLFECTCASWQVQKGEGD